MIQGETLSFPVRPNLLEMTMPAGKTVHRRRSKFQTIEVIDTMPFGRLLLLDGHIQLTELDERSYHEALVQIPLLSLENPTRALVVGGGDGGVLREICRTSSIRHVDLVEIDGEVIEVCREYLPNLSAGAFDDPRVRIHIADAFPFVKQALEPYDLIVVDCTDVYEDDEQALSEPLFTDDFYQDVRRLLSPRGIVVTQADNPVFCPYALHAAETIYERVFDKHGSYFALVPSFGGFSAFCWGSLGAEPSRAWPPSANGARLKALTPEAWAFAFSKLPF
ncbi:MAG: hypothetical protein N2109_02240 [Fimbriimonadales bacterium]|nr:hypothetical protein [Fimbriimonadales bacterium]